MSCVVPTLPCLLVFSLEITSQWIALKYYSQFSAPADSTRVSDKPCAGGILRFPDFSCLPSVLSIMMESDESHKVASIFIRECYITWFDRFVLDVKRWSTEKFGLSSTPAVFGPLLRVDREDPHRIVPTLPNQATGVSSSSPSFQPARRV